LILFSFLFFAYVPIHWNSFERNFVAKFSKTTALPLFFVLPFLFSACPFAYIYGKYIFVEGELYWNFNSMINLNMATFVINVVKKIYYKHYFKSGKKRIRKMLQEKYI
jgi:hypothetical protein